MARVNVEDELLADPRFQALVRRLGGDLEKALGRLVRFWWAAQKHWGDDHTLLPAEEFRLGDFEHLVEVGLAVQRDQGIYARGAERHFEWYAQKVDAGRRGGLRSVETRRAKYGTTDPHALKQTRSEQEAPLQENQKRSEKRPEASKNPPAPAPAPALEDNYMSPTATPLDLALLWNTHKSPKQTAIKLPTFKAGSKRWVWAAKRLSEEPDLAYWQKTIEVIAASKWCNGENDRAWVADFEFLVRQETHIKAAEGKYSDRVKPPPSDPFGGRDLGRELRERGHN